MLREIAGRIANRLPLALFRGFEGARNRAIAFAQSQRRVETPRTRAHCHSRLRATAFGRGNFLKWTSRFKIRTRRRANRTDGNWFAPEFCPRNLAANNRTP